MIKIEFPADRPDIALAMSAALQQIATGTAGAHVALAERLQQAELDHKHPVAGEGTVTGVNEQTGETHTINTQTGGVYSDANELDENTSVTGDAARLDLKGVPFDDKFCANAQDPFYASGKKSGQWKCKRGVDEAAYDTWYAQQLKQPAHTMTAPVDEETDPTPTVATGAAFGAVQSTVAPTLKTAGDFMAWVSEKQTAGRLTQEVINTAYQQLGIRVQDLFAPTPDNVVANNIAALHGYLSQVAGA